MPGLRSTTALFCLLTLLPAAILAWLGLRASAPLVEELRQQARAKAERVAGQEVVAAQAAAMARVRAAATALAAAAAHLKDALPAGGGGGALRSMESTFPDGALRLLGADGRSILPRGPVVQDFTYLPEWKRFVDLRQRYEGIVIRSQSDPHLEAAELQSGALRALALAMALEPPISGRRLQDEGWSALVAAGPRTCEVLMQSEGGRSHLAAGWHSGALYEVPATEAGRAGWIAAAGADAAAIGRQALRVRAEGGERLLRASEPVAAGAVLELLQDPVVQVASLVSQTDGDCMVTAAPAEAPAALAFTGPATARMAVATALGPVAVTASHRGLAGIEASAVRQRWLTAAGISLLLLVMVAGLLLARRALLQEARARALRDDFLASVSHELKTPLTSLCLHAEMLARDGLGDAERIRYGQVALAEGARLSAMVEDLLDFSALARGIRRIEPEPVDLDRAARELTAAWQPIVAREGVQLRCEVDGEVQALADPTALSRILANLLQNAVRHGRPPRNGGPPLIVVRTGPGPSVEVRDNGPGVPPELCERVFQRFERAGKHGRGLGLGLALSRELARACGGELTLHDDGHETVFRLALPPVGEMAP